ncbi:hypothetical protein NFHSH190041_19920 [Shewanella sp. NFH-SH190041]|uniref:hypothetical protein n=1 Tax=Shewanella sp. NFH-SH190041 TaxID=2950245 RepID=UPI0021C2B0D6|nr:hypothetical protein [Shewanella sp. NFH-SH190041]BDM64540.1 hypothetical protein NFHSH190041_19920 [Shewanella sp. NFH-SH190041]
MSQIRNPAITLEAGIRGHLSEKSGLSAWWFQRPEDEENCFVFRRISNGFVNGGLRKTGINSDIYSITLYHTDPDEALALINSITYELDDFGGLLGGYPVQLIESNGGFDQILKGEEGEAQYQFNRDFRIYY